MIALSELPPPSTEAERVRVRIHLATPSVHASTPKPALQFSRVGPRLADFSKSFLDSHRMPGKSGTSTVASSIVVHGALLVAALLVPMWFTDTLNMRTFTQTLLVAPPPPAAPMAPAALAVRASANTSSRRTTFAKGQLLVPTYIPKQVAMINEPRIAPEAGGGVPGGVVLGIPGGVFGAALDVGLPAPSPAALAPHASSAEPKAPVRVGGNIKRPRRILKVDPVYPILARRARIQGSIVISAIIDALGNVVEMKVVSGHPLLIQAAMNALKQWKYEPTILDGEPVAISLDATVNFQLSD